MSIINISRETLESLLEESMCIKLFIANLSNETIESIVGWTCNVHAVDSGICFEIRQHLSSAVMPYLIKKYGVNYVIKE